MQKIFTKEDKDNPMMISPHCSACYNFINNQTYEINRKTTYNTETCLTTKNIPREGYYCKKFIPKSYNKIIPAYIKTISDIMTNLNVPLKEALKCITIPDTEHSNQFTRLGLNLEENAKHRIKLDTINKLNLLHTISKNKMTNDYIIPLNKIPKTCKNKNCYSNKFSLLIDNNEWQCNICNNIFKIPEGPKLDTTK